MTQITHQIVVAYAQCPLKAFLLLRSEDLGTQHEYVRLIEEHARRNWIRYLDIIKQEHPTVRFGNDVDLTIGELDSIKKRHFYSHATFLSFQTEATPKTKIKGTGIFQG